MVCIIFKIFYKNALIVFLTVVLFFIILPISLQADSSSLRGDLNNDSIFNGVDLVILKKYIINNILIEISEYSADINVDDCVNIKDLVRMKKHLSGTVLHKNSTTDTFMWLIPEGEDSFATIIPVSFRVDTTCSIETSCLPGIYTSKMQMYIETKENPNEELPHLLLEVGTTTINGDVVNLQLDKNVITAPDIIWRNEISYEKFDVSNRSILKCLFTGMLSGTLFDYQQTENNFEF